MYDDKNDDEHDENDDGDDENDETDDEDEDENDADSRSTSYLVQPPSSQRLGRASPRSFEEHIFIILPIITNILIILIN